MEKFKKLATKMRKRREKETTIRAKSQEIQAKYHCARLHPVHFSRSRRGLRWARSVASTVPARLPGFRAEVNLWDH